MLTSYNIRHFLKTLTLSKHNNFQEIKIDYLGENFQNLEFFKSRLRENFYNIYNE